MAEKNKFRWNITELDEINKGSGSAEGNFPCVPRTEHDLLGSDNTSKSQGEMNKNSLFPFFLGKIPI
jgi:hypothetical protein